MAKELVSFRTAFEEKRARAIGYVASEPGIMRAAAQYGVEKRILDLCTFDVTHNPLRFGGLFDAILTDPPCKSYPVFDYRPFV